MLALNWSEEFYKNQSASFLLKLLIGLCYLRDQQSFRFHLGTVLEAANRPEFVEELSLRVPENERRVKSALEECFNFLNGADNFKSLQGLRTQIESLVLSDFGDMITSDQSGINLYDTVSNGKIAFVFWILAGTARPQRQ